MYTQSFRQSNYLQLLAICMDWRVRLGVGFHVGTQNFILLNSNKINLYCNRIKVS